jgi:hypothetical protein
MHVRTIALLRVFGGALWAFLAAACTLLGCDFDPETEPMFFLAQFHIESNGATCWV